MEKVLFLLLLVTFVFENAIASDDQGHSIPCVPTRNITIPQVRGKWHLQQIRSREDYTAHFECMSIDLLPRTEESNEYVLVATAKNNTGNERVNQYNFIATDDPGKYSGRGETFQLYDLTDDGQILLACTIIREPISFLTVLTRDKTPSSEDVNHAINSLPPPGYIAPVVYTRTNSCNL